MHVGCQLWWAGFHLLLEDWFCVERRAHVLLLLDYR